MAPRKRLGALLIEMGVIDEHQLNSALGHQKQWGGKLGSVLVQKGLCKESDVVRVLSVHLGMPVIHLHEVQIDPRAVKMVSRQVVEKLRVFPVELQGSGRSEVLTIAMAEPSDLSIVDQIAFHTGKRIKPVLTGESEIATAIALYYSEGAQPAKSAPPPPRQPTNPNVTGPNATGRVAPASISQRPSPPHIAPPVMAPSAHAEAASPSFPRPTSGRFTPPQPSFSLPTPAHAPYAPPQPSPAAVPANATPLEEIEPIDLESLAGIPGATGRTAEAVPGLEPIAAEFSPEPTSWAEAPSGEPAAPMNWDDAPAEEPAPQAPAAPYAETPSSEPEEVAWTDVAFTEPPPVAAAAPALEAHEFGAARDWSHEAPASSSAESIEEPTDELPADAILGTAEDEEAIAAADEPASFFEAPGSDPEEEAVAAAAAPTEVAAIEEVPVAPLAVDPWADLEVAQTEIGSEEPAPEATQAPLEETAAAQESPGLEPAHETSAKLEPARDPWADAAPIGEEPLAAAPAPPVVAPGAFHSEPGSIVAPDAWGEVADPLAAPAVEAAHTAPLEDTSVNDEVPAVQDAAPPDAYVAELPPAIDGSVEAEPAATDWDHPVQPASEESALSVSPAEEPLAASEVEPREAAEEEPRGALEGEPRDGREGESPSASELPEASAPASEEEPAPLESSDVAFTSDEFAPVVVPASEVAQEAAPATEVAQEAAPAAVEVEPHAEPAPEPQAEPASEIAHEVAAPETDAELHVEIEAENPSDTVIDAAPIVVESEPVAAEHEEPASAGWLGQRVSETTPLSAFDVETLAGVGIDAADGLGAMRLLAGLLRALAARQLIDLGELTVDVYAQRSEGARAAAEAPGESEAQSESQASGESEPAHDGDVQP